MAVAFSILSLCLAAFLFMRMQATEAQLKHLNQRFQESEQTRKELEQSLLAFVDEIKEGNERVLREVSQQNLTEKATHQSDKEEQYIPPLPEELAETMTYEQSSQATILMLHQKGLTATDIAKKLNMGKGEVELIIKFSSETN